MSILRGFLMFRQAGKVDLQEPAKQREILSKVFIIRFSGYDAEAGAGGKGILRGLSERLPGEMASQQAVIGVAADRIRIKKLRQERLSWLRAARQAASAEGGAGENNRRWAVVAGECKLGPCRALPRQGPIGMPQECRK